MRKLLIVPLLIATLVAFSPSQAQAQTQFELGPRVGYEVNNIETLNIGADLRIGTAALPVVINPTFDFYLSDSGSVTPSGELYENMFQFSVNALYDFGVDNRVFTPYFGPGLSVLHTTFPDIDGQTEFGLNLVGGFGFQAGWVRPYVQAQAAVGGDIEPTGLSFGVLFPLN